MSNSIELLVSKLALLPGVGEKTAFRLVLHLLKQPKNQLIDLGERLIDIANNVKECKICCNVTISNELCSICTRPGRDSTIICVISSIQDLLAIEKSSFFTGSYHVLHGVLQPINGIGPNELRFKELIQRFNDNLVKEIILATPSSIEGEATALYIKELLDNRNLKISRIASGVPVGGELQYADKLSLVKSLLNRNTI